MSIYEILTLLISLAGLILSNRKRERDKKRKRKSSRRPRRG